MSGAHAQIATHQLPETIEEFLNLFQDRFTKEKLDELEKAYYFAEKAHEGQRRKSGEPYITHPLAVGSLLAHLRLDVATVLTGFLHDTVEDTEVTLEDVSLEFGETVCELVDGVTKISQMKFRHTHEKQSENIRKMIIAMGKDVRVILVKLADRLHNMRTLNHMTYAKQAKIAQETLDIYAPLAGRLGIHSIKIELEDLSFRYSLPDRYYELAQKIEKKKREREQYIDDVKKVLLEEISKRGGFKFEVSGRPKHFYSIYKKMEMNNISYEQVFDLLAFRVCVNTVSDCYTVLGIVHSLWKPIPGRFKDFIAMPKANNYQSLHTAVIGPQGERVEIQIRTFDMHQVAEYGIAAHWQYKETSRGEKTSGKDALDKFNSLRELVSFHQQTENSNEFLENVKTDLVESEVYVFTPNGEVKEFPMGASPIDFAFSIHTDLGMRIVAARVNGKMVPLRYKLKNGDRVEVITSKTQSPSKDWLKLCVTGKAKSKIRAVVKAEQREKALTLGKELIEKAFRREGHTFSKFLDTEEFKNLQKDNGANTVEDIYVLIGYGRLTPKTVFRLLAEPKNETESTDEGFVQKAFKSITANPFTAKKKQSNSLVIVGGLDNMLVRFARCCHPIPGDSIVGFITRGRGITVHRADCERAFELDKDREVDVEWNSSAKKHETRMVRMRVVSLNIQGLLKQMTDIFSTKGIDIHNAQIKTTRDDKAVCIFDVSVKDTSHLSDVSNSLQKIEGVIGVSRD